MDLLSDILAALRLRGTLYFRTAFTAPWAIEVPRFQNVARFHYAHRGQCWISVDGAPEPVRLREGCLVIIPHGARHVIGEPEGVAVAALDRVLSESGYAGEGALVYGGDHGEPGAGRKTQLICGHFSFESGVAHPLITALPPIIHLPGGLGGGDGIADRWLDQTLTLIGAEMDRPGLGAELIALKLSEAICIEAMRAYLDGEGRGRPASAGFTDGPVRRALEVLHRDPGAQWNLESMAAAAGLSRSAFAERFRRVMGETPLAYLTRWRMMGAERLLSESALPIAEIAVRSGYRSEAAFGRAFKSFHGTTPAATRRAARTSAPTAGAG